MYKIQIRPPLGRPNFNPSFFPIPNQFATRPTSPTSFHQNLNVQIQLPKCCPSASCLHCVDHFEWLRWPGLESWGVGIHHTDPGTVKFGPVMLGQKASTRVALANRRVLLQ